MGSVQLLDLLEPACGAEPARFILAESQHVVELRVLYSQTIRKAFHGNDNRPSFPHSRHSSEPLDTSRVYRHVALEHGLSARVLSMACV
jgi:hypothetical protein